MASSCCTLHTVARGNALKRTRDQAVHLPKSLSVPLLPTGQAKICSLSYKESCVQVPPCVSISSAPGTLFDASVQVVSCFPEQATCLPISTPGCTGPSCKECHAHAFPPDKPHLNLSRLSSPLPRILLAAGILAALRSARSFLVWEPAYPLVFGLGLSDSFSSSIRWEG